MSPEAVSEFADEKVLLEMANSMDDEALALVFNTYWCWMNELTGRMCRNPDLAEQIAGDVMSHLVEKFASGDGPTHNAQGYLFRMLVNKTKDVNRRYRRSPLVILDTLRQTSDPLAMSVGEEIEELQLLDELILRMNTNLTEDERSVIMLHTLHDLPYAKIAGLIGKEENNVKVIAYRGRVGLRRSFDDGEIGY